MRTDTIQKSFREIGAEIEFKNSEIRKRYERLLVFHEKHPRNNPPTLPDRPTLNVQNRKGKETFIIDDFDNKYVDLQILDSQPDIKHLLIMVKDTRPKHLVENRISKFLCGHDERHWFVAAVPEEAHAKNVEDAMTALKPQEVVRSQSGKVKKKYKHKRKNKGYIRQGEWFFVPTPSLEINELEIHKNEPISRGMGKPHICEEVIRIGGRQVYVNSRLAPKGIYKAEFDKIIKDDKKNRWKGVWNTMIRDAEAYARGSVKHPDHKTIHLKGWHKILMNLENKAVAMKNVVFLD